MSIDNPSELIRQEGGDLFATCPKCREYLFFEGRYLVDRGQLYVGFLLSYLLGAVVALVSYLSGGWLAVTGTTLLYVVWSVAKILEELRRKWRGDA